MQKVMGFIRRAVLDYNMIEDGDTVAVGLSGGKDSLTLLAGLAGIRRFLGRDFTLKAITLESGFPDVQVDLSPLQRFCDDLGVEYVIRKTNIGDVVFNQRQEKNPCSLCAKMRRGILHEQAKRMGCNKLALGHHKDDAIETFMMNLTIEGRIACFQPVSYLSQRDLTMIRPLIYMPEKESIRVCAQNDFPIINSCCPKNGVTRRQDMKEFLAAQDRLYPGYKERVFHAMKKANISHW